MNGQQQPQHNQVNLSFLSKMMKLLRDLLCFEATPSVEESWRENATKALLTDVTEDSTLVNSFQDTLGISEEVEKQIAPNVDKLETSSCVEIVLEAEDITTVILCSVDVLKMKSIYFQNILTGQESERSNSFKKLWRRPIYVKVDNSLEAASFVRINNLLI